MRRACIVAVLLAVSAIMGIPAPAQGDSTSRVALAQHGPIFIDGNAGFVPENGVTGGAGTSMDPYRIEGWRIDGAGGIGIWLRGTDAYFVVGNITVESAPRFRFFNGIYLNNVTNGRIENVTLANNSVGLFAQGVRNLSVSDSSFLDNHMGLAFETAENVSVRGNTFIEDGISVWGPSLLQYTTFTISPDNLVNGLPVAFFKGCSDLNVDGAAIGQLIIVDCNRVQVSNLTITDTDIPISLAFVTDALISANTLRDSIRHVFLRGSRNVTVYLNNFVRAWGGPLDDGGSENRWDGAYPRGGNYWSDYTGLDKCSGPGQDVCTASDNIGDAPHAIDSNTTDPYPLMFPYGFAAQLPVASFSILPLAPLIQETITLDATASYDPDGSILSYAWDVGDGRSWTGANPISFIRYAAPGNYTITLKVTDNSQLVAMVSRLITATRPALPPVPFLSFSPASPQVDDPVFFDPGGSMDPYGRITSYFWEFGDGVTDPNPYAVHAYRRSGSYKATLTVTNDIGLQGSTSTTLFVRALAFPAIELTTLNHPAGFRLPVPTSWPATQNVAFQGTVIELQVQGPSWGDVATNVLVDTGADSSIRETREYLGDVVFDAVEELRSESPTAHLSGEWTYSQIAGHGAAVFVVRYDSSFVVQKVAVVVSDVHDRYWILLLTVDEGWFVDMNAVFERMLAGFEITLPPPVSTILVVLLVAGVSVSAAIGFVIALHLRSRRRSS